MVVKESLCIVIVCTICDWQALRQYDAAARDLFALQKIEPKNVAAKKELEVVLDLCRKVLKYVLLHFCFSNSFRNKLDGLFHFFTFLWEVVHLVFRGL